MTIFQIYKASAGSGKTYTLVKEYIKSALLSQHKIAQKPLLAITFTNKAASEMKTRIIDSLFQFTNGREKIQDDSYIKMYDDLIIELKYNDTQLIQNSKHVLASIIHYYSLFSVSTIDKFIHKIIRGFTYELDLPSNFEVEMDNEKMIQEGVLKLLDELGLDKSLTTNLIKYSSHKTAENRNWDVEEDLLKISKQLFKDSARGSIKNLLDPESIKEKQKELIVRVKYFESKIDSYYHQINNIIRNIPKTAFIYQDLPRYLDKIKATPYVDIIISKRLNASIENNNWYKKTELDSNKQKIDIISDTLCEKLQELHALIDTDYSTYLFNRECYSSFFLISVLSRIDNNINKIKKENNTIHISQFNQIIFRFLEKSSTPFIYEKIGTRYNNYFIDEFQDTSVIQWNNLVPLLEEALSVGGSCLIVGDGKQSIYRWRGGEVSQFLELCGNYNHQYLHQFETIVKSLNINYRSGFQIVDFNNNFFSFISHKLKSSYQNLYNQLNQESHNIKGGYVEISMIDLKGIEIIDETLRLIYQNITDCLNDNFSFSDIVILTRSNKDITKIATYLTEKEIPIISSESLLLKNSETIQFLLNNLVIILDESNYLSKAKLIEYLIAHKIINLDSSSSHSIISNFSKINNIEFEFFLNQYGIRYELKKLNKLNIYELMEQLIRLFLIDKKSNLYVTFFLDFVFDFSVKHSNSIHDFLNFWNQKKDVASIITPSGINAIEIMTIHKSKGLQFPIVIFPFANWKEDLGKDKEWFNISSFFSESKSEINTLLPLKKELENWPEPFPDVYIQHQENILLDNINLLYVAMTRPKERLYVITNSDSKKGAIYKYFDSFLNNKMILKVNQRIFIQGEKKQNEISNQLPQNIIKSCFMSESWRERIRIKKTNIFNKKLKDNYSVHWGNLIHDIMALINTNEDLDIVLEKLNIKKNYTHKIYERIRLEITRIINHPTVQHLFVPGLNIFLETSILSLDGTVYRPDRVVVDNHMASLIDYKTGQEKKSDYKQMEKYEAILIQLGYKKIDKYLIYLTKGDVKKI